MVNELRVSENFRMVATDEHGNQSHMIGYREFMDAVLLIRGNIAQLQHCLIAISIPKHPALAAIIVATLQTDNAFVYILQDSCQFMESECSKLGVSVLISSVINSDVAEIVFGLKIFFTFCAQIRIDAYEKTPICYIIQTSGTTGKPKSIMVPFTAIMANIRDFSKRFAVSSGDFILHSTAMTFDPSIVELFLALTSGSKLLIVPDSVRCRPALLAHIILNFDATIVQLTPSLLKLLPHSYLVRIFDAKSALRILMLGGEPFPAKFLCNYVCERTHVSIYNVYGITEVSCWASCRQWNLSEEKVDIGEPLSDTIMDVDANGELLIGGPRKCFIDGKLSDEWTPTGDLVERSLDGRIFWRGRRDDQLKLNGIRMNLTNVADAAQRIDGVQSAIAICWRNKAVVLFVKAQLNDITSALRNHLPSVWIPHAVVAVEQWPLNRHGKVDRKELLRIFEEQNCSSTRENVSSILANYGIDTMKDRDITFHSLGLTSLYATELMFKLEHLIEMPDFELLQFLLSETSTVGELLKLLKVDEIFSSNVKLSRQEEVNIRTNSHSVLYESSLAWEWNLDKCIDATPIVHKGFVFVGSHSGRFISINITDGRLNWEIKLPNRIEATAALRYGVIAIGCYDFCVYFIDEQSGSIMWTFKTGDAVKSTPMFVSEGRCIVGSHDHFVYYLDYQNQIKLWQLQCGGGILSNPLIVGDTVIVASLSGKLICASLRKGKRLRAIKPQIRRLAYAHMNSEWDFTETGVLLWETHLGSPLFASPCVVDNETFLIVDVRGNVSLRECLTASQVDDLSIGESIFAMPLMLNDSVGVLLTQNSSVLFVGIHPFCVLTRIKIGSSPFVRSPVFPFETNTIFLQNTTGQLFALELNKLNPLWQTKSVSSPRVEESVRRQSSGNYVNETMWQGRSCTVLERRAVPLTAILDSPSENRRITAESDALVEVEDIVESVTEVIAQNTETFGGVVILKSKVGAETNCVNYCALIGSRDNCLRCFIVVKKPTN